MLAQPANKSWLTLRMLQIWLKWRQHCAYSTLLRVIPGAMPCWRSKGCAPPPATPSTNCTHLGEGRILDMAGVNGPHVQLRLVPPAT